MMLENCIFYYKALSHSDLILDNKLWDMVLLVDITENCKLIYKKELKQREYLDNEVIPTAWLLDSIPQVILPCANLTLFTQGEKTHIKYIPIENTNMKFIQRKKLNERKFHIIFLLNM